MLWIAPSEKDTADTLLEQSLRDVADQFHLNSGFKFHGGKLSDISIYGQESNATTRRLAVMNLALRGIEADFGPANPPFNVNAVDKERLKDRVGSNRTFPFGLPLTDNRSGSCMRDAYTNLWFNPDFVTKGRAATSIKLGSERTADEISAT